MNFPTQQEEKENKWNKFPPASEEDVKLSQKLKSHPEENTFEKKLLAMMDLLKDLINQAELDVGKELTIKSEVSSKDNLLAQQFRDDFMKIIVKYGKSSLGK